MEDCFFCQNKLLRCRLAKKCHCQKLNFLQTQLGWCEIFQHLWKRLQKLEKAIKTEAVRLKGCEAAKVWRVGHFENLYLLRLRACLINFLTSNISHPLTYTLPPPSVVPWFWIHFFRSYKRKNFRMDRFLADFPPIFGPFSAVCTTPVTQSFSVFLVVMAVKGVKVLLKVISKLTQVADRCIKICKSSMKRLSSPLPSSRLKNTPIIPLD